MPESGKEKCVNEDLRDNNEPSNLKDPLHSTARQSSSQQSWEQNMKLAYQSGKRLRKCDYK